jgi:hypothetical protein
MSISRALLASRSGVLNAGDPMSRTIVSASGQPSSTIPSQSSAEPGRQGRLSSTGKPPV